MFRLVPIARRVRLKPSGDSCCRRQTPPSFSLFLHCNFHAHDVFHDDHGVLAYDLRRVVILYFRTNRRLWFRARLSPNFEDGPHFPGLQDSLGLLKLFRGRVCVFAADLKPSPRPSERAHDCGVAGVFRTISTTTISQVCQHSLVLLKLSELGHLHRPPCIKHAKIAEAGCVQEPK